MIDRHIACSHRRRWRGNVLEFDWVRTRDDVSQTRAALDRDRVVRRLGIFRADQRSAVSGGTAVQHDRRAGHEQICGDRVGAVECDVLGH